MPARQVALCNADETGQACFRRQQVVAAAVERAVFAAIADRQQPAQGIDEKAERHLICQCQQRGRECLEPPVHVGTLHIGCFEVQDPGLDGPARSVTPVLQVIRCGRHGFGQRDADATGQRRELPGELSCGRLRRGGAGAQRAQRQDRTVQFALQRAAQL